jgi:hypothetical protein
MDNYKLKLLRERDEIWAEARETMPLFEKFFSQDASDEEDAKIGLSSIKLIATELYTYTDEIENIDKKVLDLYSKEIKSGAIDTLKFANKEIEILKDKIVDLGREEETREQVEANLEDIRGYIKNVRLIFLYNMLKYKDVVGHMLIEVMDSEGSGEFTKEEQAALARCKIMTYYLLVLEESEIESLDGSWFQ